MTTRIYINCYYHNKEILINNIKCNIIKSMSNCVNKLLPSNIKIEMFKNTKLSSCFNVKNKIDFEHDHDLIYHAKCPEPTCIDD